MEQKPFTSSDLQTMTSHLAEKGMVAPCTFPDRGRDLVETGMRLDTALQLLGDAVLTHHDYNPPAYMAKEWESVDAALVAFNDALAKAREVSR